MATPAVSAPRPQPAEEVATAAPAAPPATALLVPIAAVVVLVLIVAGFVARGRLSRDLDARWPR